MPTLKEKIDQFFDKYRAIIDFEELELRANKISNLDNFLVEKDKNEQRALTFLRSAALTYLQAIDNTAKMRSDGTYDFTSLDILQFVRDFEDLMKAKHEDSNTLEERPPYGGASFAKAVNRIIDETTDTYNKPLHEIWAKNVLAGKYTVEEMKLVAQASIETLRSVSSREMGYEKSKILLNVLMSKAAMEKIRENRGWGYALRHPILNYRENKFLEMLTKTVQEYQRREYPIELVTNANNKPILEGAFAAIKNYNQRQKMKSAGIPKSQSIEEKQSAIQDVKALNSNKAIEDIKPKAPIISKVGEKMKLATLNETALSLKLAETFPEGSMYKGTTLKAMARGIAERLLLEVQTANNKYDLEIMNGKDQRLAMIDHVKHVFKSAYALSQMIYGYEKDQYALRLFAAQRMTDIVMKNYSPVYFEREKLAEFAQGYPLNHLSHCADAVDMIRNNPLFKEAKEMYDNNVCEEAFELINEYEDEALVPPVDNVPSDNLSRINQK